jgi:hypothetical protein
MAVLYPDILKHNNSTLALIDLFDARGGYIKVALLSSLYSLPIDKLEENVTIAFVLATRTEYRLKDIFNFDNSDGWEDISAISINEVYNSLEDSDTIVWEFTAGNKIKGSVNLGYLDTIYSQLGHHHNYSDIDDFTDGVNDIINNNLGVTIAPLSSGLIPIIYLPSYVDDVIEVANYAALPSIGEVGKIYVTLNDNKIYRWSGSTYVNIATSPGTTDDVVEGSVNLYYTDTRVAAYCNTNHYTKTQINNFFSGGTTITGYNKSNWDSAYGWGNHASAGYALAASLDDYVTLGGNEEIYGNKNITGFFSFKSYSAIIKNSAELGSVQLLYTGEDDNFGVVEFPAVTDTETEQIAYRSWIESQGYLNYIPNLYAVLGQDNHTGGISIRLDGTDQILTDNGSYLSRGSFDNGGGTEGISLMCSVGFELNWQSGWLSSWNGSTYVPIKFSSAIEANNVSGIIVNTLGNYNVVLKGDNTDALGQDGGDYILKTDARYYGIIITDSWLNSGDAVANFSLLTIASEDVATQNWITTSLGNQTLSADFNDLYVQGNTVATQDWVGNNYLGIIATASNSTKWNGYDNCLACGVQGADGSMLPIGIRGDGLVLRYSAAAFQSMLGLGSNAYTSTAYLPISGGELTGDLISKRIRSITTTGEVGGNFTMWKDATPTKAFAIGFNNEGSGATNDFNISRYTGSGWFKTLVIDNATGIVSFENGLTSKGKLEINQDALNSLDIKTTNLSAAIRISNNHAGTPNYWNLAAGISGGTANDFGLTRGAGYTPVFVVNGTTGNVTFSGSINGTSATFTSGINVNNDAFFRGKTTGGVEVPLLGVAGDDNIYVGDIFAGVPSANLSFRTNGATRLTLSSTGLATFSGEIQGTSQRLSSFLEVSGIIYQRDHINVRNKANNGWLTWAERNTTGSEVKIDLSNIRNISASGNINATYLGVGTIETNAIGTDAISGAGNSFVNVVQEMLVAGNVQATSYSLNTNEYINWGGSYAGSSGYGFRDNYGIMQYKNSGGVWTNFADYAISVNISNSDYEIVGSEEYVEFSGFTNNRNCTLPSPSSFDGKRLVISLVGIGGYQLDFVGDFIPVDLSTNVISSLTMARTMIIYSNGTLWRIVNDYNVPL